MKLTLIAMTLASLSCSTIAQSVNQPYGAVMYDTATTKDTKASGGFGEAKPKSARFTFGAVVIDNLAVEGSFLVGMGFADTSASAMSIKNKNGYSIALRPFINVTPDLELFGRIGKLRSTTDWREGTDSGSDTTTNTIYGAGLAYKVTNDVRAVVDFTKSPEKNDTKSSSIGIGVRFNF